MMNNAKVTVGQKLYFEGIEYRVKAVGLFNVTLFRPEVLGHDRKVAKKDLYGKFMPVEEGIAPLKRACDIVPDRAYSEAGTECLRAVYNTPTPATQPGVVHLGTLYAIRDDNAPQPRNYIGSLKSVCDAPASNETWGW